MSTLLLRLAAPLQSWGVTAKFERRNTERIPSKSGVIGLVASALGRRRNENIDDLLNLRFGVRTDQEGILLRDYHTVKSEKSAYVTHRYYLSDGVFLSGLEGNETLLEEIDHVLRNPSFPLFLGRRSCPPEGRLSLGIRKGKSLIMALQEEPWLISNWERSNNRFSEVRLSISIDAGEKDASSYFQRDVPLSYDQTHRKFAFRSISVKKPVVFPIPGSNFAVSEISTMHDPIGELEG